MVTSYVVGRAHGYFTYARALIHFNILPRLHFMISRNVC